MPDAGFTSWFFFRGAPAKVSFIHQGGFALSFLLLGTLVLVVDNIGIITEIEIDDTRSSAQTRVAFEIPAPDIMVLSCLDRKRNFTCDHFYWWDRATFVTWIVFTCDLTWGLIRTHDTPTNDDLKILASTRGLDISSSLPHTPAFLEHPFGCPLAGSLALE